MLICNYFIRSFSLEGDKFLSSEKGGKTFTKLVNFIYQNKFMKEIVTNLLHNSLKFVREYYTCLSILGKKEYLKGEHLDTITKMSDFCESFIKEYNQNKNISLQLSFFCESNID